MVELFSNIRDPDQMPPSAAYDLYLHCLSVTRLGVSSLQWVKTAGNSEKPALTRRSDFVPLCIDVSVPIFILGYSLPLSGHF